MDKVRLIYGLVAAGCIGAVSLPAVTPTADAIDNAWRSLIASLLTFIIAKLYDIEKRISKLEERDGFKKS